MKNQPGTMKNHEKHPGTMKNQSGGKVLIFRLRLRRVTTDLHDTEWKSAHFSLLTYTGSQLTF